MPLNARERRRLLRILGTQSASGDQLAMTGLMCQMLRDAGCRVEVRRGNVYAHKGDAEALRPFYVAHLDTVHRVVPDKHYAVDSYEWDGTTIYYARDPETGIQRGVGGDDKCGLFVALEATRSFDDVSVILCRDEEAGVIGAQLVTPEDLERATVLIQADRRGNRDAVRKGWVKLSSPEWQWHVDPILEHYEYSWCDNGVITDVIAMHESGAAGVSAINLSAGYHNPHTNNEIIVESHLDRCLDLAIELGMESRDKKWAHLGVRTWNNAGDWYDDDHESYYWSDFRPKDSADVTKGGTRTASGQYITDRIPAKDDDVIDAEFREARYDEVYYAALATMREHDEKELEREELLQEIMDSEISADLLKAQIKEAIYDVSGTRRSTLTICGYMACVEDAVAYFADHDEWYCGEHMDWAESILAEYVESEGAQGGN